MKKFKINLESKYDISSIPENATEAMVYISYQNNKILYSAEQAICNGTIFPVLYKPFKISKEGEL